MLKLLFTFDLIVEIICWLGFLHISRTICRRIIPHYLLRLAGAKDVDLEKTHRKAFRAGDSIWKVLFYMASFSACLFFANQMNMITDISNAWQNASVSSTLVCSGEMCFVDTGLSKTQVLSHHDELFQKFYLAELLYYVFGIWSLIVGLEIVKKDAVLLYIHHIVTILLILGSNWLSFEKIGLMVLLAHDVGDIFLEFALFIGYICKIETIKNISFGVLEVVWILSRLVYFPFWVIWTCIFDSKPFLLQVYSAEQANTIQYVFIGLLTSLLCMHIFWTSIMIKMAYSTLVLKKPVQDERD